MKTRLNIKFLAAWFLGVTMLVSCTDNAVLEAPEVLQEETSSVATLIAGLSNEGENSRLAYEKSGGAIKISWAEGDELTANPNPTNTTYAYPFSLSSGIGTSTGAFSCSTPINSYLPQNVQSEGWKVYYPGSIKYDQDWFDKSYVGQTQNGDDNIDHLKNYHSIRLSINGSVTFDNTYIDFNGENVEESMCMKFVLSNFPSSIPKKIELMYMDEKGKFESCFHVYNFPNEYYTGTTPHGDVTPIMPLELSGFSENTTELTAYMMLSNSPINVVAGGKFRVNLTTLTDKYYCDVNINNNVTLEGGKLHSITCKNWTAINALDGFASSDNVKVLQEKTTGNGTDIIIMGDGFNEEQFGVDDEDYAAVMQRAYEDFFSIEPYAALQNYFNVYVINAVSEDSHDAEPYWSGGSQGNGAQNGATNRSANTVFNTQFIPGKTSITGNDATALNYAMQAIRSKGGSGGTAVTNEAEVYRRANTALIMVMVNVKAHAGTCGLVWTDGSDYGDAYSVAYTALGSDGTGAGCKWTTIHEAGGHGFGKLADEYGGNVYTTFLPTEWEKLVNHHNYGVNRNVNKHWCVEDETDWGNPNWVITKQEDLYWSELLSNEYLYKNELSNTSIAEGLGMYRGAMTFEKLYCRPTYNSVMRDQFAANGQFFNAISRWAIWYRLMKLTGTGSYANFKSSLSDFINFDKTLTIEKSKNTSSRGVLRPQEYKPLAPPVMIKARWENGRLITE